MHNIINRRVAELEDLAEGMNELGLIDLMHENGECVHPVLFPRQVQSIIDGGDVKSLIKLDEENSDSTQAMELLCQYIDHLESETQGTVLSNVDH